MLYPLDDTIVAIASPPGGAARGILRLSGPDVRECVSRVFRPDPPVDLSEVRVPTAVSGDAVLPGFAAPLPCELYLWPGPRSYTGQPAAEFHTLGSPPLLETLLAALGRAGARLAQPGEFTLRAFLSGRLDLTRAEAVLGVIDAADGRELDVALAQLAGGLAGPLRRLREQLLDLLAHLEAGFDFADEDITFIEPEELDRQLALATDTLDRLVQQMTSRSETGDLVRVVLVGWPNTGKSSLFNALTGGPRALVSDQPGTTRDYLTAEIDLDGVACLLVDTAGLEQAEAGSDSVSTAARAATLRQTEQAQVQLLCLDASRPLNAWEESELATDRSGRLVVLTKAEMPRGVRLFRPAIETSSYTGGGLDELRTQLRAAASEAQSSGVSGDLVASTVARCRQFLHLAADCLHRSREVLSVGDELVAAELRTALEELGKVVGAVYTDDVLDRVFSRFCVGK